MVVGCGGKKDISELWGCWGRGDGDKKKEVENFFYFSNKTAYKMSACLIDSYMNLRDRPKP